MTLFIITIEWKLGITPENTAFESILTSNFKIQKLTEYSYLIESSNTAVEIRNYIVNAMPTIERVFVGELSTSAAWRNMQSSSNDIKLMFENE